MKFKSLWVVIVSIQIQTFVGISFACVIIHQKYYKLNCIIFSNISLYIQVGYRFNTLKVIPCNGAAISIVEPVIVSKTTNDQCEFRTSSCALIRPYKTFTAEVKLFDANSMMQIYEAKLDVCKDSETVKSNGKIDLLKTNLIGWGIPLTCPVEETFVHCYNKTQVFSFPVSFQRMVPLLAKISVMKIVTKTFHDTGTSCFELYTTITKNV